jgi:hypothetical protein
MLVLTSLRDALKFSQNKSADPPPISFYHSFSHEMTAKPLAVSAHVGLYNSEKHACVEVAFRDGKSTTGVSFISTTNNMAVVGKFINPVADDR